MIRMLILTRDVTREECFWLKQDLTKGNAVYEYEGCTYGCVDSGIAVTDEPHALPFYEVPADAVQEAQIGETTPCC